MAIKTIFKAGLNMLTGGLGGGVVSIIKKLLGGRQKDRKLENELKSQKVAARERRKRALIKASPWPLRLVALAMWFAPFIAPAWPGVTVQDVTSYVDNVINGMPDWYINIGLMMYGFLWGGSEWKSLQADRDEVKLTEKEIDRDTQHERNHQTPPGGGPR